MTEEKPASSPWLHAAQDYIAHRLEQDHIIWTLGPPSDSPKKEELKEFLEAIRIGAKNGEKSDRHGLANLANGMNTDFKSEEWVKPSEESQNQGVESSKNSDERDSNQRPWAVAERLLNQPSWPKIASLYALGGLLAVKASEEQRESLETLAEWISKSVKEFAGQWIENNNGIQGIVALVQEASQEGKTEEGKQEEEKSVKIPLLVEEKGIERKVRRKLSSFLTVGKYQINVLSDTSKLGEGRFGIVYKGTEVATGRGVALKRLPDESVRADELATIKSLDNPHIVQYLGIESVSDGFSYIVMELCDMDLADFLAKHTCLSGENLNTTVHALADGYLALHKVNIVHRDLKPQNILVTAAQSRRVETEGGDFSNLAGTFYYMAPEVGANLLEESFYDSKVDMWSMGVLLHECATGRIPFEENDLCKMFLKAVNGNYASYQPPKAAKVIGSNGKAEESAWRLMQIDPDKRLTPEQFHGFVIGDEIIAEDDEESDSEPDSESAGCIRMKSRRSSEKSKNGLETAAQKNERLRLEREKQSRKGAKATRKCCTPANFTYYCCCFCCCKNC